MSWVDEGERIWQETSTWRADRTHLRFGGRGGFLLTAVVIAAFGWVDITTLERVFHLAITPLAVLWGFQQFYPSDEAAWVSEQRDFRRAWRRAIERAARLSGIYAVVAILLFTALPNETVKGFLFPLVIIPAAVSIGSTKTRILDKYHQNADTTDEPTAIQDIGTSYRPPPHNIVSFPHWSVIIDYMVVVLLFTGVQRITDSDIGLLRWLVVFLFLLLYNWLTIAKWGRGIGGKLTRTKVQSIYLDQPPSSVRALIRAVGTVFGLGLWLLALFTGSWFGLQAFVGVMTARSFVALWFTPIQGRGLNDIISGTRVVKVLRSESV